MQSQLEFDGQAPTEIVKYLPKIRGWLREIPDKVPRWSINGIVRACANTFPLNGWQPVDGFFLRRNFHHAWLARRDLQMVFVLDLAPPYCMGGPILIATQRSASLSSSPWAETYMGDMQRFAADQPKYLREADDLRQVMGPLTA